MLTDTANPSHRAFARRVEEAFLNAWPAMQQTLLDGWLLRFSKGFTKRANSIVPLYPSMNPINEKVRYCENAYAREKLQTIFRLTSLDKREALDTYLAQRGYAEVEPSRVLYAPLATEPSTNVKKPAGFRLVAFEPWLDAYTQLTGMTDTARTLHALVLKGIQCECAFAVVERQERVVACGLGVIDQDLLGLFDIVTHPTHRNQGLGETLVGSLLRWGADQGAQFSYLAMVAANEPAAALYAKLRFRDLYHYWYRVS